MNAVTPIRLPLHYFLCDCCGYGVAVRVAPATCPMCRATAWIEITARRESSATPLR
jgi:rubrerythrin